MSDLYKNYTMSINGTNFYKEHTQRQRNVGYLYYNVHARDVFSDILDK